jgi:hypothetical protein
MKRVAHTLASMLTGALLGWYLMVPPVVCQRGRPNLVDGNTAILQSPCEIDPSRPLREWVSNGAYDTSADCRVAIATVGNDNNGQTHPVLNVRILAGAGVRESETNRLLARPMDDTDFQPKLQCVASDDPRLAR